MLLNLTVSDAKGAQQGSAQLFLDWGPIPRWYLEKESPAGLWERVGYTPSGPFEPRPPDIIWLWDRPHNHNTVVFWTAPQRSDQTAPNSGEARIYDPRDPVLKEGHIRWAIDLRELPAGPPIGSGLRNPNVDERAMIVTADQRRRFILETAAPRVDPIIAAYRAKDGAAVRPFTHALRSLNIFGDRLDPNKQDGQDCIPHLVKASELLNTNRDYAPVIFVVNREAGRAGLYADAFDLDSRDPRGPMVIYPRFFDARPECRTFVLMHEYFHLAGVIDHGHPGFGDTRPAWALGDPSSLVHFSWRLAAGSSPDCDERSPILNPLPRARGGIVA
jgi:hypothetical protein